MVGRHVQRGKGEQYSSGTKVDLETRSASPLRHTQTYDLAVLVLRFTLPCANDVVTRTPSHSDGVAVAAFDAVQANGLSDAVALFGSEGA